VIDLGELRRHPGQRVIRDAQKYTSDVGRKVSHVVRCNGGSDIGSQLAS